MYRSTGLVFEWGSQIQPYLGYETHKLFYGGFGVYIAQTVEGFFDIRNSVQVESVPYMETLDDIGEAWVDVAVSSEAQEDGFGVLAAAYSGNLPDYSTHILRKSFGNNTIGTCTAVACGLALNYLDIMLDDNIVPPKYQAENLTGTNWNSSSYPKTGALHDHLVKDCYLPPISYGNEVHFGIGNYYRNLNPTVTPTGISVDWTFETAFHLGWGWVEAEINNGQPLLVTTPPFNFTDYDSHTMLVYGYDVTASGTKSLRVHTGWYSASYMTGSAGTSAQTGNTYISPPLFWMFIASV